MRATRRSIALLSVTLAISACSGTASTQAPSGSPGSSGQTSGASVPPSADPAVGAIDHKTGAADVLLRIEQGGGFVAMEFRATQAPAFTLYGNGVIVFQQTVTTFPAPDANGVIRGVPWRIGSLDETQVQDLLEFALGSGGLGAARDTYMANGIADAPDTIFTIHAGGVDKTVVVNALAEEVQPGPDGLARSAFSKLAKRLQNFDQGGSIPSDVYRADRYRGVLIEREVQPGIVTTAWPWAGLQPTDFKEPANDGTSPAFPYRSLTTDEIAELKLADIEGGVQGITLKAPNGKLYSFILRPLLIDETQ
ncbi:MAG: hypothetical protein H0V73_12250 [Chloroflexi bacterium]|nr:hypothetical protein [Chloroflexota bacterium]